MKWICVNDMLPEPGERVIATTGTFVGEFWRKQTGEWCRYNEVDFDVAITHWMYFPDA